VHGEDLTVAETFLSEAWLAEIEQLRSSTEGLLVPPGLGGLLINLVIEDDPNGVGTYQLAGAAGGLAIRSGHAEGAAATVTLPCDLARAMFVDQNQQAVMQGFTAGQLKIDGDMTKLMALGQSLMAVDATRAAFDQKVKDLTA
jgi:hypothetical protein